MKLSRQQGDFFLRPGPRKKEVGNVTHLATATALARALAGGGRESSQSLLLLETERDRDLHHCLDQQVTTAAAAKPSGPQAREAEVRSRLCSRRYFQRLSAALEQGDVDLRAERGFSDTHNEPVRKIVARAVKLRVGLDPDFDMEIARSAPSPGRFAMTGKPESRPGRNPAGISARTLRSDSRAPTPDTWGTGP